MMAPTRLLLGALSATCLAACAVFGRPGADLIDRLPVVTVGELPPTPEDFIVYFPAGQEFRVQLGMDGTLFQTPAHATVRARLKKDLYLYKYWASHDGRRWRRSHSLIQVRPSGGLNAEGGKWEIELNEAP